MTTKFMLCSFKTCPWVQRAAIVLRAKKIEYEINYIDRDNRPEWFLKVSPHSKVPVLVVDGKDSLFESNAIAEYLDETVPPRLHPEDPLARARNRAWTDFAPDFAEAISATAYSNSEEEFAKNAATIAKPFGKLDEALSRRGNDGPYFNGPKFSLVDAAYAPFLQRYTFMDRLKPVGAIEKFPRLAAWRAPRQRRRQGFDRAEHRGGVAGESHPAQALAGEVRLEDRARRRRGVSQKRIRRKPCPIPRWWIRTTS
jgi:glutathione S-transferase